MILTLSWKELREHRSIWLTMVVMTAILGFGLARIVASADVMLAASVSAMTVLGMGGAYGVVCGAMMLAGEHEGGTLAFLDIFLGRRYLLWIGKFLVGIVLVLVEAETVALAIYLMQQTPPSWAPTLIGGFGGGVARAPGLANWASGPEIWFLILPVVTLEAFAWGLLGSSLSRRVLAGAAIATAAATPIWMTLICLPPPVFFVVRLMAAGVVLIVSFVHFITQARESSTQRTAPDDASDLLARFADPAEEFDWQDKYADDEQPEHDVPTVFPAGVAMASPPNGQPFPGKARARRRNIPQAESPGEVLWWLTFKQAWAPLCILAVVSLVVGLVVPANAQVLWPLATLLLGVACGTAAFAPEQRDLSYQFLSSQHFPLHAIWRFKTLFWLSASVAATVIVALAGGLVLTMRFLAQRAGAPAAVPILHTLVEIMGPIQFFSIWLVYGFCAGTTVVWYCRKNVLALLLASMVSAAGLGLWLPSLLCLGMRGWQLWLPPLALLTAGYFLVRAWAGGRIKERRPVIAMASVAGAVALWAGVNFAYRAFEIPDVGEPLDRLAFKEAIPAGQQNAGGAKVQDALAEMDRPEDHSMERIAEAARLPLGVIEVPRGDGQSPSLRLLPACRRLTTRLAEAALKNSPDANLEYLDQILALSRNMRNRASLDFYVAGVQAEETALDGLDRLLRRGKPTAKVLRRASDVLNRHADETPPPLDCLQTECYRAGGVQANPVLWTFSGGPDAPGKIPERWLARGVALSLEMPWEEERRARLWQLVWAGLFRGVKTPHWQRPPPSDPLAVKDTTRRILRGWLPAIEGPGASMTAAHLAQLLDASWLSDERLYCSVPPLRAAANRSQCRVAAWRQAVALALYQLDEGQPAKKLDDLVPKYLATLPIDPYSGEPFHYRVSPGEHVLLLGNVRPGQAILWSAGPDRVDHGGHQHGDHLEDDNPSWSRGSFDLVTLVPN
jgi:hypothetical protein